VPEKTVLDYPAWTILWVGGLSILGGIAHYIRRVNSGLAHKFSIRELIGELFISGFAGLMTFFMCDASHLDIRMTAVAVGMAGHMGSHAIFIIEQYLKSKSGIKIEDEKEVVK
jgi:hypothetical protein